LAILLMVASCAWAAQRHLGVNHALRRLALGWLGLILVQVLLGAATIWSNKAADIATAHVIVGALSLATGTLLVLIARRYVVPATARLSAAAGLPLSPFRAEPAGPAV
jgi:cytochrome c oxidase assembly protein subunit 15